MSFQYLKKEVRDEVDFLHVDKVSAFATSKFPGWFQHFGYQSFLQVDTIIIDGHDLYNISKKKLGMEFIFCMQINRVSSSWQYPLMEVGQTCPKYPKYAVGNIFGRS